MKDRDLIAAGCLAGLTQCLVNADELDVLLAEELADKAYLLADAMLRRSQGCQCETGKRACGVPGVLCTLDRYGQMDSVPERCDVCQRFPDDATAARALAARLNGSHTR